MLHVDIPSKEEFLQLAETHADACVSIYIETTPVSTEQEASKISFSNAIKEVTQQLSAHNFDKRRLILLQDELEAVLEDTDFWRFHAHTLAVFATADQIRTFRLANKIQHHISVSQQFYLKPLLRAMTFPHSAYVLALSENAVRLVEFFASGAPQEIKLSEMPEDALSAVGRHSLTSRAVQGRIHGPEGRKLLLAQYTRKTDHALRPLLLNNPVPLILVTTELLSSIYRSTNTVLSLLPDTIFTNPEHINLTDLVALARPELDKYYQSQLQELHELFDRRSKERRTTTDLSDAARAATQGAISVLLADIDSVVNGSVDSAGNITFADNNDPWNVGIVDEIVKRAMMTGARVLAVRKEDLPGAQG
ncbi:MAG: hypothetical protein ACRC5A_00885, partial [Enterobacteriaceae bacterium]